jgi:dienelactone hydrolase
MLRKKNFLFFILLNLFYSLGYSEEILVQDMKIPVTIKGLFFSDTVHLATKIFRPEREGKFPLIIINHGTPVSKATLREFRPLFKRESEYFVKKGFVVAVPTRRGYGDSEGSFCETSGEWNNPNYEYPSKEAVKDIKGVLEYLKTQPYVDPSKILLIGQSAGGHASLCYASQYPGDIIGVVNFAGGHGSNGNLQVGNPSRLIMTLKDFGKTTQVPTLWIYAEDDRFFPPPLPRKMFDAFSNNGGKGTIHILPPGSGAGHSAFVNRRTVWEPIVNNFLKELNLP